MKGEMRRGALLYYWISDTLKFDVITDINGLLMLIDLTSEPIRRVGQFGRTEFNNGICLGL